VKKEHEHHWVFSKWKDNTILSLLGSLAFFLSLLISKNLLVVISLFTSLLSPYFIIIAPCLMALKISEKIGVDRNEKIFICCFGVFMTSCLLISVIVNLLISFGLVDRA